ncbi:phage holin family protein [Oscillatoria sp. FACHB-1407]|uniref:phage holin family protein n=1 Tax=Oscillatoria sp. FACHB-1407 TaxID=2692847 RepID=UPI001682E2F2|nr:phage holin family protein [Oscillatoria sp. FACHB-1407]MBD2461691.1 phage holin family protein [Oscillatoria sp. FACHB-1407]
MNWLIGLVVVWLVTAVSLFIISKLPLGIDIDSFNKALVSSAVFGILNAILGPILRFLGAPITFLTLGLFAIVINGFIFGLAAWLVQGFRLRWGIWSALLGGFLLGIINALIFRILGGILPGFASFAS